MSASYSGRVQTVLNFCLFGKVVSLLTLVHCPVTLFHTSSTSFRQLADGNFQSSVYALLHLTAFQMLGDLQASPLQQAGARSSFLSPISCIHFLGIPLARSASYSRRVQTVLNFCLFGKVVSLLTLVHCPVTLFHTSSNSCWQLADGNILPGVYALLYWTAFQMLGDLQVSLLQQAGARSSFLCPISCIHFLGIPLAPRPVTQLLREANWAPGIFCLEKLFLF